MEEESKTFDIQAYMTRGVERVVSDALKATLKNPRESAFMLSFAAASKRASAKRRMSEDNGEHIPPFLIASITSSCNLHCAGCYSRCNHATSDLAPVNQLSGEEWLRVFEEADEAGISFVLLAGGEPLLRRDVIEAAGKKKGILFPIFTNGTFLDQKYIELFDRCRNLVPVISIEGGKENTDSRRGQGVYDIVTSTMDLLNEKGIIFGASVTVSKRNIHDLASDSFLDSLMQKGCRLVIFVEYVPVTEDTENLAPGDEERNFLTKRIAELRESKPEMVYISFPGDEKNSDGCVAAGRGFFHINSHGGAEPCPFSPYSDVNIKNVSLRDALKSPLFKALQTEGLLQDDHKGGCVLYEKRALVEEIIHRSLV